MEIIWKLYGIKGVRAKLDICRGGDYTQRDTATGIPLDSSELLIKCYPTFKQTWSLLVGKCLTNISVF